MTAPELYLALCIEAGTYDAPALNAMEWFEACAHNMTQGLRDDLAKAAGGDAVALAEARAACGLGAL